MFIEQSATWSRKKKVLKIYRQKLMNDTNFIENACHQIWTKHIRIGISETPEYESWESNCGEPASRPPDEGVDPAPISRETKRQLSKHQARRRRVFTLPPSPPAEMTQLRTCEARSRPPDAGASPQHPPCFTCGIDEALLA
ncbi:hypothetical protein HPB47_021823 [Ixodes persulcatus]|uniref:Uncharacterized protein n=1 Tax=Ixodes persulcatus TaxID=34615 RepID=A0AC60QBI5_IXOPE|nr:hypothetical protein HPB47_021823 [Ixodes persulcatus]